MPGDTVADVLRTQARLRGDHPLLICDAERLSYLQAQRQSSVLARRLLALGAGKGTHVGLLYPNSVAFVIGALAAARLGAVVVPFPTFATAPELRRQLVHSDVRILLAAESYRSHDYRHRLTEALGGVDLDHTESIFSRHAPQLRRVLFATATPDLPGADDTHLHAVESDVDGHDRLVIIYTSGSAGTPKAVVHTHAGLLGHQRNLNEIRRLTVTDILFCNSPFFWIGGFGYALLATVLAGSTLLCSTAADAGATLDLLEAEKPTVTNGFAGTVAGLARHRSFGRRDLTTLRRGNLYPIMAPQTRPADTALRHNMLGLTETGGPVLLSGDETDQPEHRRGSFGKPAPGFECRVESGELLLRGRYLMQGYHKRSREESFDADGWFHTGDLVRTDADGYYYYLGRRDAVIKTGGANVSPAEVEAAITKVTGCAAVHVFGLPDPERGQVVAAVIVPGSAQVNVASLGDRLRTELSAYKIPRRVTTVAADDLPLLPGGKVDTRGLAKAFHG
ncbi:acyl--CoA ligase [Mycolicibacillus parakoreensis]|uniref:Acyl--CoA ligase n=1 Tax=Mycolicibacillus parakoreensis TaxID=1069221 RepID=A0ABY3TXN9_9MYCO|nr:class I adenylate-forming enzyme family protein [Mycolicibacillus parakoreensis]MCV7317041.1 acyl--CoA ligase [Mycolicibacillus parakoreensis]ULN51373.1 acyl--CoA ligase [Mycolicibacillus parakoreensis]